MYCTLNYIIIKIKNLYKIWGDFFCKQLEFFKIILSYDHRAHRYHVRERRDFRPVYHIKPFKNFVIF